MNDINETNECRDDLWSSAVDGRCVHDVMPSSDEFAKLESLFKMFADASRCKILWALSSDDVSVADICELVGMSKSAVSHQLKQLKLSNLVRYRRQGKFVMYSLADAHVREILHNTMEHIRE